MNDEKEGPGKRYPLLVYFGLACAISWSFMIPAFIISEQNGYVLPTAATVGELMETGFKDGRHLWLAFVATYVISGTSLKDWRR